MPSANDIYPRLRERLLLDWDAPLLRGPLFVTESGAARKKLTELASARSEAGLIWSVFRTFARLPAHAWARRLLSCCPTAPTEAITSVSMEFWAQARPPQSRLLWLLDHIDALGANLPDGGVVARRLQRVKADIERWRAIVAAHPQAVGGDGVLESPVELDVTLEAPGVKVALKAVFAKDIQTGTEIDPARDEIARCLDALLDGVTPRQEPYFLFVSDDYAHEGLYTSAMAYESLMPRYRDEPAFLATQLPHRSEGDLARLRGRIGWTTWADVTDNILDGFGEYNNEQRALLRKLVDYLKPKKLLHRGG